MGKYPIVYQLDSMDCGAACLSMVCEHFGLDHSLASLRDLTYVDKEGVSLLNIKTAAESIGLETLPVKVAYKKLQEDLPLPAIAHWDQNHFVVIYEVLDDEVIIGDPAIGERKLSRTEFIHKWGDIEANEGAVLLLEKSEEGSASTDSEQAVETDLPIEKESTSTHEVESSKDLVPASIAASSISVFGLLKHNKSFWWHLVLGSILMFLIFLFLPLVIKELVDSGALLENQNLLHTGLIAFALLGLVRILLELSSNWMFQQQAATTNATLVSNYLEKLTRQPIRFFEKRLKWDILQRVYDNYKVGEFFQSSLVQAFFYLIMLISSSVALLVIAPDLLLIFLVGLSLQFLALNMFRRSRIYAKQEMVQSAAQSQDTLFEIINGISAIKMNNAEAYNQGLWEKNQANLLEKRLKFSKVDQWQKTVIKAIGWAIEIGLLYVALTTLMYGELSVGSLMAVIYILAYSKNALVHFFDVLSNYQEVKLSLLRLNELSELRPKEYAISEQGYFSTFKDLKVEGLTYRYGDMRNPTILNNIDLVIPKGKRTAIVGVSGVGKTTLLKLLMGMYIPNEGKVSIGKLNIQDIAPALRNQKMAAVFENGYIFSDSIEANVSMMSNVIDKHRLNKVIKNACLDTFVDSLPLGLKTRLGEEGVELSRGQKQQILLARAFYKNPEILFFDEATSALDGITERRLLKNIDEAFEGKTTVFVAHRLNTIKNADQILVLHKGIIVERGTHEELLEKRGAYFLILRNDLE